MRCKAFEAVVEIEVQAVTCPGVWLCPNGKITVQIYMLGNSTQTSPLHPVFPLLYHEKFIFRKTFTKVRKLNDLERLLSKEWVFIELIQWADCENGNVLATFKTSLTELLYPPPYCKGVVAGVDVDLLMEAKRCFPGIITPKLEVSTKTTIEEVLCTFKNGGKQHMIIVNPKLISSKCTPKRKVPIHQKRVCHSFAYHRSRDYRKPKIATSCQCSSTRNDCTCKIKRKQSPVCTDNEELNSPRARSPCENNICSCRDTTYRKLSKPPSARKQEYRRSPTISPRNRQNDCPCTIKPQPEDVHNKSKTVRHTSRHQSPEKSSPKCMCREGGEKKVKCSVCSKYKYAFSSPCACTKKNKTQREHKCQCSKSECDCRDGNLESEKNTHRKRQGTCQKNERISISDMDDRPSLAKEIHKRLEKTLSDNSCFCLSSSDLVRDKPHFSTCDSSLNRESCSERFYKNLENFYKHLYKRAHYKAKNERNKSKACAM